MRRAHISSRDRAVLMSSLDLSETASRTTGSSSRVRSSGRSDRDRDARISRARSVAALNRVQEVEAKNFQLQRYKESAREKTAELERCMEEMGAKDLQIRDMQYEIAKLKKERAAREEQRKETDARNRSNIAALRAGLESLEQSVKEKHAYLTQETNQMLEVVESLLRHTMNGFHAGPTRTVGDLLHTLQTRLATMHDTLQVEQMNHHNQTTSDPAQPHTQQSTAQLKRRSASSASMKGATRTRTQPRSAGVSKPAEVGRSVSAEAGVSAQRTSKQTQPGKPDPSMAKLINQYRAVIVKEREQTALLKTQLAEEKSVNQTLLEEMKQLKVDLREVFQDRKIDHGRLIAAEADRAKLLMLLEEKMGSEELETRRRSLRHRQKKPHRRRSAECMVTPQEEDSSIGPGATSEEAAEQDIRVLDDQIGRLKLKLERAALDHTNEIMSKVVHCAGSNLQHSEA